MLRRNETARQRWGGRHQSLDHWLNERQEMLIRYFQMAGLPPYAKPSRHLPPSDEIKAFCQILVDYVSTGHFEVYEHLLKNSDISSEQANQLSRQVFPLITVTTERALTFNDKYAEITEQDPLSDFDRDLSALGEALEVRMELEDRLLQSLEDEAVIA